MKKTLSLLLVFAGAFAILGQGLTIRSAFYLPSIQPSTGGGGGGSSITKIFDVAKNGNISECTTNGNSTGSTVIFWGVGAYTTPPTLNDQTNGVNTGNSWLQLTNIGSSGFYESLYCCTNPVTGTNHSFILSGGDGTEFMTSQIAGFSGQTTAPVAGDSRNSATAGAVNNRTYTNSPVTGKLHVGFVKVGGDGCCTPTVDSGFTLLSVTSFLIYQSAFAYKIQSSSMSEGPTWSNNFDNTSWTGIISALE